MLLLLSKRRQHRSSGDIVGELGDGRGAVREFCSYAATSIPPWKTRAAFKRGKRPSERLAAGRATPSLVIPEFRALGVSRQLMSTGGAEREAGPGGGGGVRRCCSGRLRCSQAKPTTGVAARSLLRPNSRADGYFRAMEILPSLWRFEAIHPAWEEGDDWGPAVAWCAARTPAGLVLIDPLVDDWNALDALVQVAGACAAIVRPCWWHERSIEAARGRYAADVWARELSEGAPPRHIDHAAVDGDELPGGLQAFTVARDDEIGLWLPEQRALVFGDVMVRAKNGTLLMCPESWIARAGGHAALRMALQKLLAFDVKHVLVSHGPLVLGGGYDALASALH